MSNQEVEVLVVGAGQAGIAMSEHLSLQGVPHLVVERDRIAERWRTGRWDSLVANGPAWHDRFPGQEFNVDPDAFATKDQVADYFAAYAEKIDAPIRTGVEVTSVRKNNGRRVSTWKRPKAPSTRATSWPRRDRSRSRSSRRSFPDSAGIHQIHSSSYRNPQQLPEGAVLVVGAGSSGVQIADELQQSGRQVYLAVGPHDRPPRSYRGRDFCWWLGVLGKWDASAPPRRRRARHDRRQRSTRRTHRRLPGTRRRRDHAARTGRCVRERRHALRARPSHQHRERRRELPVACSTRPTPTSPATVSTCPRSRRPASSARIRTA